jgi:hypothetical protein
MLVNKDTVYKFLTLIAGKGLSWSCSTRLDHLNVDLIKKLSLAGCQALFIGIESGSTRMQKKIRKNLQLDKLPHILQSLSENNIGFTLSFIIGLPGETKSDTNKTLLCALRSALFDFIRRVLIEPSTILKGSDLYQGAKYSLCKRELTPNIFTPILTNLQAEQDIVSISPEIFPSFYPKYDSFKPEALHRICYLFNFLAGAFPVTTLLLLNFFKISPLRLANMIIPFFEYMRINWRQPVKIKIILSFLVFFKRFLRKLNPDDLIIEIAMHEELFLKSWFLQKPSHINPVIFSLSLCPQIAPQVKINTYKYNIPKIYDAMRNTNNHGYDFKKERAPVTLAYVPRKIARVVQIGPIAKKLLSQCNGKTSLQEIFYQTFGKEERSKKAKSLLIDKFKFLQDQGLICFV